MKISSRVVSKKPISLSRAAKLISRFAAVDNGSSPAVSIYLQRTADAFNQLVQFHSKTKNLIQTQNAESELTSINNLDETKKEKKEKKRKRIDEDSELTSIGKEKKSSGE